MRKLPELPSRRGLVDATLRLLTRTRALGRQRQDHLAVLGLPVVASQEVGHTPDEGGVISDGLVVAHDVS
jgi:hypothetical protein